VTLTHISKQGPHAARWLITTLVAASTFVAPGCRAMRPDGSPEALTTAPAGATHRQIGDTATELTLTKPTRYPVQRVTYEPPSLPQAAFAPIPPGADQYCPPQGGPAAEGPWSPDGLARPWPIDEYIWDGGDRDTLVEVGNDWTVRGLDQEDTVAHYDTVDGRVQVTPSNRVPIYAPRFAAVRQIHGPEIHQSREGVAAAERNLRLRSQDTRQLASAALQPEQVVREHNLRSPVLMRDQTRGLPIATALLPSGFSNRFLPHEDLLLIQRGTYLASEKARLTELTRAALIWSSDQMAQAVIDGVTAHLAQDSYVPGETYNYELPPGKPRLRLVKVASQSEALPGEIIDFTLRFDNVGEQKIGNVTIVDSLTTRLEYVEGSAQCSLKAKFGTQENDGDSLVLRWEIDDPLDTGAGGIIRFKCRVR